MTEPSYKIREKYRQNFQVEFQKLNDEQKTAVQAIDGPVMVVAGPGTGKTQILAMRVAEILEKSPGAAPHNILCLTFTDAATIAMRNRLVQIIGPEAHKVHIYTYHGFTNQVIQDNLGYFGDYRQLDALDDLERVDVFNEIFENLPNDHLLKRVKGNQSYESKRLQNLFDTMKRESLSSSDMLKTIDDYIEEKRDSEDFLAKRKATDKKTGTVYQKGDFRDDWFKNKVLSKMDLLKAGVNLFDQYQAILNRIGRYDFHDMILWVNRAFTENDELLGQYQERYQYYLVDEFQDTNGAQSHLIEQLITFMDFKPNVFVVGDDDQAIYKFQGANLNNIKDFFEKHNPEMVILKNNYRSSQLILDASKALIENNTERIINHPNLNISKDLIAEGKHKALGIKPRLLAFNNLVHEQAYITNEIIRMHEAQQDMSQMAVIYRNHSQVDKIVSVLEKQGVSLNIKRKVNILKLPIIINLLTILRYLQTEREKPGAADDLLFTILHYYFFNIPSIDIGKIVMHKRFAEGYPSLRDIMRDKELLEEIGVKSAQEIVTFELKLDKWISDISNVTLQILFQNILNEGGVLFHIFNKSNKTWLLQIVSTLFDHIKDESNKKPDISLSQYLNIIDKMIDYEIELPINKVVSSEKGIHFITSHSAKGLEFERVYIVGCTKDIWDQKRSGHNFFSYPEKVNADVITNDEDERRLFYVAMTRAEKELNILFSGAKENGKDLGVSKFVDELKSDANLEAENMEVDVDLVSNFQNSYLRIQDKMPKLIDHDLIDRVLKKYVLSVTGLNKYLNCQVSFYFDTILKVPSARNKYMGFGRAIHWGLQRHYEELSAGKQSDVKALEKFFVQGMKDHRSHFTDMEYKDLTEYGCRIMGQYFDKYLSEGHQAKGFATEAKIDNTEYKGIPIKGVLDLVEIYENEVRVIDYKTGDHEKDGTKKKLRPPKSDEDAGGDYWRQIVFYKMLLDSDGKHNWQMTSGTIDFVEPSRKTSDLKKQKYVVSPKDIDRVGGQIEKAWTGIHNHEFTKLCENERCHWCDFVRNEYVFAEGSEADYEMDMDEMG